MLRERPKEIAKKKKKKKDEEAQSFFRIFVSQPYGDTHPGCVSAGANGGDTSAPT